MRSSVLANDPTLAFQVLLNNGGASPLAGIEVRLIRDKAPDNHLSVDIQRFVSFIESLYEEPLPFPSTSFSSPSTSIKILVASTKRSMSIPSRRYSSSTLISFLGVFMGLCSRSKRLVDAPLGRLFNVFQAPF